MTECYEWAPLLEAPCPEMRGPEGNETDPAESRVVSMEIRFPGERTTHYADWTTAAAAARVTLAVALAGVDGRGAVIRAVRLREGNRTVTIPAATLGRMILNVSEAKEWMPQHPDERAGYLATIRAAAENNSAGSAMLVARG